MLIFDLIVGIKQDQSHQFETYLLNFQAISEAYAALIPNLLAPPYRNVSESGNRVMSCPSHCGRD